MSAYTAAQWFLFFYVYCFLGWCFESTVVSVSKRKWINRGFCKGPVIPIYGFGALAILFVTLPVRNWVIPVFFLGMVVATILEYGVGYLCEIIFKVRYWDYSSRPFNVKGYICLRSSLCWGVLSVLLIEFLHVRVESWILRIPGEISNIIALIMTTLFMYDFASSVKTALDLRDMLAQLEAYSQKAREEVRGLQSRLELAASVRKEEWEQKLEDYRKREEGESIFRWITGMERIASTLEQNEKVGQIRQELQAWHIRVQEHWDAARRRMTKDKIRLLKRNPTTISRRYGQLLQKLLTRAQEKAEQDSKK